MSKTFQVLFAVALIAAVFFLGTRSSHREGEHRGERKILYYVDPMNPSHTSPEPGLAPCGMKLEPVYADETSSQPSGSAAGMDPGAVKISAERQQMIGLTTGEVERKSITRTLRTLGRVSADENRVYRIIASIDGWVWDVFGSTTGSLVKKDQVLATYYTRELLTSLQSLYYALGAHERYKNESEDQHSIIAEQVRQAEDNLIALGVTQKQIDNLKQSRERTTTIEMRAPVAGIVLSRNIYPGQRVERNAELFRIADLSRIWILADVFDNERSYVRPGTKARVSLPGDPAGVEAEVSEVLPQFDPASRTLKVRLETDNPNYELRPDMFVDVEFQITLPATVNVPVDAVLDSGIEKRVFVDRGNGFFEPRDVTTGWKFGDRVEIIDGLKPGEKIITSGNFLVDSESKMKLAATGMTGKLSKCQGCGMVVSQSQAKAKGLEVEYSGRNYYFCSEECKSAFLTAARKEEKQRAQGGGPAAPPITEASPPPAAGHSHEMMGQGEMAAPAPHNASGAPPMRMEMVPDRNGAASSGGQPPARVRSRHHGPAAQTGLMVIPQPGTATPGMNGANEAGASEGEANQPPPQEVSPPSAPDHSSMPSQHLGMSHD